VHAATLSASLKLVLRTTRREQVASLKLVGKYMARKHLQAADTQRRALGASHLTATAARAWEHAVELGRARREGEQAAQRRLVAAEAAHAATLAGTLRAQACTHGAALAAAKASAEGAARERTAAERSRVRAERERDRQERGALALALDRQGAEHGKAERAWAGEREEAARTAQRVEGAAKRAAAQAAQASAMRLAVLAPRLAAEDLQVGEGAAHKREGAAHQRHSLDRHSLARSRTLLATRSGRHTSFTRSLLQYCSHNHCNVAWRTVLPFTGGGLRATLAARGGNGARRRGVRAGLGGADRGTGCHASGQDLDSGARDGGEEAGGDGAGTEQGQGPKGSVGAYGAGVARARARAASACARLRSLAASPLHGREPRVTFLKPVHQPLLKRHGAVGRRGLFVSFIFTGVVRWCRWPRTHHPGVFLHADGLSRRGTRRHHT
jgi:hypothetical protein